MKIRGVVVDRRRQPYSGNSAESSLANQVHISFVAILFPLERCGLRMSNRPKAASALVSSLDFNMQQAYSMSIKGLSIAWLDFSYGAISMNQNRVMGSGTWAIGE